MSGRRATVYFDPELHRALKLKAATQDRSLSDVVNDAVREALLEDADDLAAVRLRKHEPVVDFEQLLASMRRRGKL